MMLVSPIHIEQKPTGKIVLACNGQRREVAGIASALRLIEAMLGSAGKTGRAPAAPSRATRTPGTAIRALAGKYRDTLTATDQRAAEKRREIDLEERKLKDRTA
jgi:hypothetical protein